MRSIGWSGSRSGPKRWTLARRADAVLAGGEGDRASRARARQTVADLEMVARLEEVRLQGSELSVEPGGRLATRETARRYQEAFRDYGVDVEALPAAEAAARLRSERVGRRPPRGGAGQLVAADRGRPKRATRAAADRGLGDRFGSLAVPVTGSGCGKRRRGPRPPGSGGGYGATAAAIPGVAGLGLEETGARDPPCCNTLARGTPVTSGSGSSCQVSSRTVIRRRRCATPM